MNQQPARAPLPADPLPAQQSGQGAGPAARGARCAQRRPRSLPNYSTLPGVLGFFCMTQRPGAGKGSGQPTLQSTLQPRSAGSSHRLNATRSHTSLLSTTPGAEPSLEQIEAEFWRIVESPEEQVESLYGQVRIIFAQHSPQHPPDMLVGATADSPACPTCRLLRATWGQSLCSLPGQQHKLALPPPPSPHPPQDVDSGHHGSGFPLPLWRRRLLEQFLTRQVAAAGGTGTVELPGYASGEQL